MYTNITGIGAYVPKKVLTNAELETMIDTSNEWIIQRTGVQERHIAAENEFSSDLAIKAVENLLSIPALSIDDVDMVVVTTFTADHLTPSVAALVQGHFAIKNAGTMDLNAACTGFTYGLCVADSLLTAGHSKKILLIAAETTSKILDYTQRGSCILFGDAAVAVLIEKNSSHRQILQSYFTSDGSLAPLVACSNLAPTVNHKPFEKEHIFQQEGPLLYEYVIKNIPTGIQTLLDKNNLSLNQIDWFIPHSANLRMIKSLCTKLNFPFEKTLISNDFYGNTSSASIPLAIWLGQQNLKIKKGDILLLYGFGAGLTHGGIIIKW